MSVKTRPRASLGRVIEDLGTTLLDAVAGDVEANALIDTVVIHDVLDDAMTMRRALVLGVGLKDPHEVAALLTVLRDQEATALVLRAPVEVDPGGPIAVASAATGVPVLALTRGASWAQLAAMLRALIAEGDLGQQETGSVGGTATGDLFAIANAVSTLLDAPVTIEDRSSRVLAFSSRQDEADGPRVETILGARCPTATCASWRSAASSASSTAAPTRSTWPR